MSVPVRKAPRPFDDLDSARAIALGEMAITASRNHVDPLSVPPLRLWNPADGVLISRSVLKTGHEPHGCAFGIPTPLFRFVEPAFKLRAMAAKAGAR